MHTLILESEKLRNTKVFAIRLDLGRFFYGKSLHSFISWLSRTISESY